MTLMINSELARRLFAGVWFAVTAFIPVAYYLLTDPLNGAGLPVLGSSLILTAIVPIASGGIFGVLLGSGILDPEETKNAGSALGRGLLIALISYLLLFICPVLVQALFAEDIVGFLILSIIIFLYGLLYAGWLIALSGAAAGGLLYLFRLKLAGSR